eukprot:TRINITY_DN7998_c0_g8_i1.p1 TRINITY_DN7998_c0_g8~~TRINITY_DN7998_c0_g8_i1.p1  ORF type:complete len:1017 (-),score=233.55 TRINITY_DN7998_c0_g8_i1:4-3000(-)
MAYCEGSGLETFIVGEVASFTLFTAEKDADVKVSILGPDDQEVSAEVIPVSEDSFDVEWEPKEYGTYIITVTVNNTPVKGSPFTVTSDGKLTAPEQQKDHSEGYSIVLPKEGKAGEPSMFIVNGAFPLDQLKVVISGPESLPAEIFDNQDASFDVEFTPKIPGTYTVHILVNGFDVPGSPFTHHVAGSASEVNVDGQGIIRAHPGSVAVFTLICPNRVAINDISVNIKGPGETTHKIFDNEDGSYDVEWTPSSVGQYILDVSVTGLSVTGNPFTVPCEEDNASLICTVDGSGVTVVPDHDIPCFTLYVKDHQGNPVPNISPHDITITITPSTRNPVIYSNDDGSYDVEYEALQSGPHVVDIKVLGKPITNSPFNVQIGAIKTSGNTERINIPRSHTKIPDPSRCKVGLPPTEFKPNEVVEFYIFICDSTGSPTTGGDHVAVAISGPGGPKANVEDCKDGTYKVQINPTQPGDYVVTCSVSGKPIGDPVPISVRHSLKDLKVGLSGSGLKGGATGKLLSFIISLKDKNSSIYPLNSSDVNVIISGPSKVDPNCSADDGVINVEYTANVDGNYNIIIELYGKKIFNGVSKVTTPKPIVPPASASHSSVTKEQSKNKVNDTATFLITARDSYGKPKTVGGDSFSVKLKDGPHSVESNVVDNKDGTYRASFISSVAGIYVWDIKLNDNPIKGSPLSVFLNTDPAVKKCLVEGSVTHGSVGRSSCFVVSPQSDGQVVSVPSSALTVTITDQQGGSISPVITPDATKGYLVSFTPLKEVQHFINVALFGKQIWKGTCKVKKDVSSSYSSTSGSSIHCTLKGSGLHRATVKATNTFSITVLENNKPKIIDPNVLSVAIKGPAPLPTSLTNNNDGTYTITYTPTVEGSYETDITLFGKSILPAPIKLSVEAIPKSINCKLRGTGIKTTTIGINTFIVAVNQNNVPLTNIQGIPIEVLITGPSPSKPTIKPLGNGEYEVNYNIDTKGAYKLVLNSFGRKVLEKDLKV